MITRVSFLVPVVSESWTTGRKRSVSILFRASGMWSASWVFGFIAGSSWCFNVKWSE